MLAATMLDFPLVFVFISPARFRFYANRFPSKARLYAS